jgi:tyrosyl-tRNA synthetase
MFGKIMSISDALMYRYYELCTDWTVSEVDQLRRRVEAGEKHPRQAKVELAKLVVRDFHNAEQANRAEEEFSRVFQQGLVPDEVEERQLPLQGGRVRLGKLIAQLGLASSVAEANRLIEQEAVTLNDQKVTALRTELDLSRSATYRLKVGKRRFMKLTIGTGS